MIRKYVFLAIGVSFVAACGQQPSRINAVAPSVSFADAYAAAEAALAEAAARRNVWSKTEGLLEQSKIAYADGRQDAAVKLANEARLHAELAVTQAISQEKDWQKTCYFE